MSPEGWYHPLNAPSVYLHLDRAVLLDQKDPSARRQIPLVTVYPAPNLPLDAHSALQPLDPGRDVRTLSLYQLAVMFCHPSSRAAARSVLVPAEVC